MHVVNEEECISCMACESECPTGALPGLMRNCVRTAVSARPFAPPALLNKNKVLPLTIDFF